MNLMKKHMIEAAARAASDFSLPMTVLRFKRGTWTYTDAQRATDFRITAPRAELAVTMLPAGYFGGAR